MIHAMDGNEVIFSQLLRKHKNWADFSKVSVHKQDKNLSDNASAFSTPAIDGSSAGWPSDVDVKQGGQKEVPNLSSIKNTALVIAIDTNNTAKTTDNSNTRMRTC